jgi:phosphoribosylformylglycinamidine synthase
LKISVTVTLKKDVLDPQGKVVNQTLKNMGFDNISAVRQGKFFEIDIEESDKKKVKNLAEEVCKKLLTNTVIEEYKINIY